MASTASKDGENKSVKCTILDMMTMNVFARLRTSCSPLHPAVYCFSCAIALSVRVYLILNSVIIMSAILLCAAGTPVNGILWRLLLYVLSSVSQSMFTLQLLCAVLSTQKFVLCFCVCNGMSQQRPISRHFYYNTKFFMTMSKILRQFWNLRKLAPLHLGHDVYLLNRHSANQKSGTISTAL